MRVALPHNLGREEVRRRMRERSHEISDFFPGGLASVETAWSGEDRLNMTIDAMGQQIMGGIDIEDSQVVIEFDLPAALGMARSLIERAVRKEGAKLLEKK
ncbi:MAG: polyhydroxyalkanoic acid system family protein [Erythrobacter sp.]